jgi:hypothetical protein
VHGLRRLESHATGVEHFGGGDSARRILQTDPGDPNVAIEQKGGPCAAPLRRHFARSGDELASGRIIQLGRIGAAVASTFPDRSKIAT